jgi:UPF0271 protein
VKLDLNCDLGEGEPLRRTRALMRWITSANVACGGHAGDAATMEACVRLARQNGVWLGAHPGPWNRQTFGRHPIRISPDDLELLLLQQVSALEKIARAGGARLHHIKLHGALYHATDGNTALAKRYLAAVKRWWPAAVVYARAGGQVARHGRAGAVMVWEEGFVDRAYCDDGSLVPRNEPGALLTGVRAISERVRRLLFKGEVLSSTGNRLRLAPRTVCLHSDTPKAVEFARVTAGFLGLRTGGR